MSEPNSTAISQSNPKAFNVDQFHSWLMPVWAAFMSVMSVWGVLSHRSDSDVTKGMTTLLIVGWCIMIPIHTRLHARIAALEQRLLESELPRD